MTYREQRIVGGQDKRSQASRNESVFFAAELGGDSPEIDLHGLDIQAALSVVDHRIDQAFMKGERIIKIIHGSGTGKLRNAVREHLSKHELIDDSRPASGAFHEGVTYTIISKK